MTMKTMLQCIQEHLRSDRLDGVRISINKVEGNVQQIVELYDNGAIVIVSDPNKDAITSLNRILYERSGSIARYKVSSTYAIQLEKANVFLNCTEEPKSNEVCYQSICTYPQKEVQQTRITPQRADPRAASS